MDLSQNRWWGYGASSSSVSSRLASIALRATVRHSAMRLASVVPPQPAPLLVYSNSQREHSPCMSVAVSRWWRSDLTFVRRCDKPTRTVRVDGICTKVQPTA